jgi:hypothetical protein
MTNKISKRTCGVLMHVSFWSLSTTPNRYRCEDAMITPGKKRILFHRRWYSSRHADFNNNARIEWLPVVPERARANSPVVREGGGDYCGPSRMAANTVGMVAPTSGGRDPSVLVVGPTIEKSAHPQRKDWVRLVDANGGNYLLLEVKVLEIEVTFRPPSHCFK